MNLLLPAANIFAMRPAAPHSRPAPAPFARPDPYSRRGRQRDGAAADRSRRRAPADSSSPPARSGMKSLLRTERAEIFFYAANGHGGWEAVIANLVAPGVAMLVPGTGHFSDCGPSRCRRSAASPCGRPTVKVFRSIRRRSRRRCATTRSIASAPSSSSTPTPRAARPATSPRSGGAIDAVRPSGALRRRRRRLAGGGAVRDGRARRQRRHRRVAEGADGPSRARLRRRRRAGPRGGARQPDAALLLGLAAPAQRSLVPQVLRHAAARPSRRPRRPPSASSPPKGWGACTPATRALPRAVHAAVERWAEGGALRLFTQVPAARSVSVTAVEVVARRRSGGAARARPRALPGGHRRRSRPAHGRVFRIGHLGDMNEAMILGCLAGVEAAMRVQGVAFGPRRRRGGRLARRLERHRGRLAIEASPAASSCGRGCRDAPARRRT